MGEITKWCGTCKHGKRTDIGIYRCAYREKSNRLLAGLSKYSHLARNGWCCENYEFRE